ncbi:tetratricopeptide repeat protein [Kitasatospora kifunensis]|uniref:Tetratricopeptide (TPR) repeat protein n=1 Tax=Kitasatospora kifunensis TaxID=58351 RepID=A0A7W7VWY4_KITKI|nr:tetratricopeptide (TPR) repeat protein [Kitasatospora kifunensis]
MQARSVTGGIHFHHRSDQPPGSPRPQQLPGGISRFVNRTVELNRLDAFLSSTADEDGDRRETSLCVIAGTAGAGKTSLALRWAHRVQDRFPDGQLHINLRGYDPGEPVTPLEALHRFLPALGVPTPAVPVETEAAAALYRSLLADRRMLIVLDNAGGARQVRPLLPGNPHCLVLVTSRGRLSGLAVHDGAHHLTLGTLPEPEAVALLRAVTAGYRPVDDPEKLVELARLCARLPLALRIAAERAASHPHMRLDELIADLRDESALWEALSTGGEEEADAVRSVFAWSYRALPPDAARLFRLLGLHPGPEFGTGAVAALAALSIRRTRQLLDVLVTAHMLEQTAPDRYEFHDLLRAYATDQAQAEESRDDRTAALRRVLDWYLHAADAAQSWISPAEDHVPLDPPEPTITPPAFADYDQAVDFSEREHLNFPPAVQAAERAGLDRHAWQLSAVLENSRAPSAPATGWLATAQIGLRAARRLGERAAAARLLESLGFGHVKLNQLIEAVDCHRAALAIRRELGDREGEATSLNALGLIHLRRRELADAEAHFGQAMAVFDALGAVHWATVTLSNLAGAHLQAGQLAEAAEQINRALATHRESGDKGCIGDALCILSAIHLDLGEPLEALRSAQEAVELALDLRSHAAEGYWLLALGDAQQALGRFADALTSYHRSASLHRRLGDRSREARAWHGAGETYRRLDRNVDAADLLRSAAATQRELDDAWQEALALAALADALRAAEPQQAVRHWTEALRLLTGYDDPRAVRTREAVTGCLAEAVAADTRE